MGKFNTTTARPAGHGPLAAEASPAGVTHEGGPGYARDARSELFQRATASFAGEDSFYEKADTRDDRLRDLIAGLATDDEGFAWLQGFLPWLRDSANIRTAPVILAAETVRARLAKGITGGNRQIIGSVLLRPDEPGEMLAYWTSRYGRAVPKPVKRGVADAVARLYSERAFLRYDSTARGFRFGDVIELVHPAPQPSALAREGMTLAEHGVAFADSLRRQGDLFQWAITARHNRDEEPPESLRAIRARRALARMDPAERHRAVLSSDTTLQDAMAGQWEWLLSWLGEMPAGGGLSKAAQWELVLPHLGYMAAIRNLRNLDEAGVSDEIAAPLAARIADPEQVKRSRQLPFRFLSAYLNAPSLRWGHALEKALDASLANVPELPGRTLILVDTSASMMNAMSGKSKMAMVQAAALFGVATAVRNAGRADLCGFADGQFKVEVRPGSSVLRATEEFCRLIGQAGHGTQIAAAVGATYAGHDRVLIFTDMQTFAAGGGWGGWGAGNVTDAAPKHIPMYGFNLVGYGNSAIPAGHGNRHEMGGLTDQTFTQIPLIEAGMAARWPWLEG